jgi:hypothetical protein
VASLSLLFVSVSLIQLYRLSGEEKRIELQRKLSATEDETTKLRRDYEHLKKENTRCGNRFDAFVRLLSLVSDASM